METIRVSKRHGRPASVVAAVMLFFLIAGCASNPGTPEDSPRASEQEVIERVRKENEVGEAALAKLAGTYGVVRDPSATRYLNLMLKSLALSVERQELQYNAGILASDQVNAFALPGGFILVNLGTLKQIENPTELAGILAHELGHVNHRHILENVTIETETSFAETLARLLSGSRQVITSAMGQINDGIEERLFLEGYAADDEYEADEYGVVLLQALGIGARPYYDYLSRLSEVESEAVMASLDTTHPPLTERLVRIDEMLVDGLATLPITPEFTEFMRTIQSLELPR